MRRDIRWLPLCALLLLPVITATAQDPAVTERIRLMGEPTDAAGHMRRINMELDNGPSPVVTQYIRRFLNSKPTEADILKLLESREGIAGFTKFTTVPQWSRNPKENEEGRKAARELLDLVTKVDQAARRRAGEPAAIRGWMAQLQGTPEEQAYAVRELYKLGANVVPYFVDALVRTKDAAERLALVKALKKLGPATLMPLLVSLDSNNTMLKLDVLDVLRSTHSRYAREITPYLWYLAAAPTEPESVRKNAKALLADLQHLPPDKLPLAKVALTREAERYYDHQVEFGDPKSVVLWRWDGDKPVQGLPGAATVTASQAEEYIAQGFLSKALRLDPDYKPAQVLSLSLAVDKAMEKAGPSAPLSRTSPAVSELLAKSSAELVIDVLDKALKDKRTNVVLAAVRALGERAETRAKRPSTTGDPALVKALYYPDPRVQMAAATALVNIPGPPAPGTAARIVEVLARALKPAAAYREGRKILVALSDEGMRNRVRQYVSEMGAEPIVVTNGKDAMRQLRAHPEIEAILLDSTLPYPGLANLLAQLRQDVHFGKVPIVLAAVPETRASRDAAYRYKFLQGRLDSIRTDTRVYRGVLARLDEEENKEKKDLDAEFARERRVLPEVRAQAYKAIEDKYAARRAQVTLDFPAAVALLNEVPGLEKQMNREIEIYDLESQIREVALENYVKPYSNIQVVHASAMVNAAGLDRMVTINIREAGVAVSADEKRELADRAMATLANLAEGKPEGFDVRPATTDIANALKEARLSPEGQQAAIRALTQLDGATAQSGLAAVVLDGARNPALRVAAARGLIVSVQRQGSRLTAAEVDSLRKVAEQRDGDARVKDQVDNLLGTLRTSPRRTGEQLRDYRPVPAAPLPAPKEGK